MYDLLGQNIATVIQLCLTMSNTRTCTHTRTRTCTHTRTRTHTHTHRTGVETLWNMLSEVNVKPDAELVALVSYWVFILR